jgi:hypothetical protein
VLFVAADVESVNWHKTHKGGTQLGCRYLFRENVESLIRREIGLRPACKEAQHMPVDALRVLDAEVII